MINENKGTLDGVIEELQRTNTLLSKQIELSADPFSFYKSAVINTSADLKKITLYLQDPKFVELIKGYEESKKTK